MADIMGSFDGAKYGFFHTSLQSNWNNGVASQRPTKLTRKIKYLFFLLFMMQIINSLDRGYISGNMDTITLELDLKGAQAGSLGSVFIAGLVISIIPTTYLSNIIDRPFFLMSCGFSIWTIATFISAITQNYLQLIICRAFVGVGDSMFSVLAVPFVDYNVPVRIRGRLMGFFMCLFPIGMALGTALAGFIDDWRVGFVVEASLMAPFLICGFFSNFRQKLSKGRHIIKNESLEATDETESDYLLSISDSISSGEQMFFSHQRLAELRTVILNPIFWLGCFGNAGLLGVSAGMGMWNVAYARIVLHTEKNVAAPILGVAVAVGGILGTVIGGSLLDFCGHRQGGKSCCLAFVLSGTFSLIALPILTSAYLVTNFNQFLILVFIGVTFLMVAGSNFALATIWAVDVKHRVIASGMVTLIAALCGTVPIPIIVGSLKGDDPNDFPPWVLIVLSFWMLWPAILSYISALGAKIKGIGINVDSE